MFRIIRLAEFLTLTGLSKSTAYNRFNEGLLPPPFPLGGRAVGFILSEVEQVLQAMAQGRNNQEIKDLVSKLVIDRQSKKGELK